MNDNKEQYTEIEIWKYRNRVRSGQRLMADVLRNTDMKRIPGFAEKAEEMNQEKYYKLWKNFEEWKELINDYKKNIMKTSNRNLGWMELEEMAINEIKEQCVYFFLEKEVMRERAANNIHTFKQNTDEVTRKNIDKILSYCEEKNIDYVDLFHTTAMASYKEVIEADYKKGEIMLKEKISLDHSLVRNGDIDKVLNNKVDIETLKTGFIFEKDEEWYVTPTQELAVLSKIALYEGLEIDLDFVKGPIDAIETRRVYITETPEKVEKILLNKSKDFLGIEYALTDTVISIEKIGFEEWRIHDTDLNVKRTLDSGQIKEIYNIDKEELENIPNSNIIVAKSYYAKRVDGEYYLSEDKNELRGNFDKEYPNEKVIKAENRELFLGKTKEEARENCRRCNSRVR